MECLDELSSDVRGQNTGKDKDHPPVASPPAANHTSSLSDAPEALFDSPWQTLVHLGPAIRHKQDPSPSESHSHNLLLGVPLHTVQPTFALR